MTEDEAICVLEDELVSASGWLARVRRGETKDGALPARIYEALRSLTQAWARTTFIPKHAVIPMMQVDSVFSEMNDPQHVLPDELPDELPDSLGDLLIEMGTIQSKTG
jgi:hypothetical protein